MKNVLMIMAFLCLGFFQTSASCTKVVVYAKQSQTKPLEKKFTTTNVTSAFDKSQKALDSLGYEVLQTDESRYQIVTGWKPTLGNSHYMELFKRKDYSGNAGTYYQVVVDIAEAHPAVRVSVSTRLKSIVGELKSAYVIEKKVMDRISDFIRSPQIEMTNVGVQER